MNLLVQRITVPRMKTSTSTLCLCLAVVVLLVSQTLACRRQCKGERRKRSEDPDNSSSATDILHDLLEGKKTTSSSEVAEAIKMLTWPEVFSEWRRTVSDWYQKDVASRENTAEIVPSNVIISEETVSASDMNNSDENRSSSKDDTTTPEKNVSSSVDDMPTSEENVSLSRILMSQHFRQMSDSEENDFDTRKGMAEGKRITDSTDNLREFDVNVIRN